MFRDNLVQLRKITHMTQEDLAEKVNVSRQTLSKWETGESLPDIKKSKLLAEVFGVTLDDLVNHESTVHGLGVPPKGKHAFGLVTVGDKGQIVIPAKARKVFNINPGDQLIVLGDEEQGIAKSLTPISNGGLILAPPGHCTGSASGGVSQHHWCCQPSTKALYFLPSSSLSFSSCSLIYCMIVSSLTFPTVDT